MNPLHSPKSLIDLGVDHSYLPTPRAGMNRFALAEVIGEFSLSVTSQAILDFHWLLFFLGADLQLEQSLQSQIAHEYLTLCLPMKGDHLLSNPVELTRS